MGSIHQFHIFTRLSFLLVHNFLTMSMNLVTPAKILILFLIISMMPMATRGRLLPDDLPAARATRGAVSVGSHALLCRLGYRTLANQSPVPEKMRRNLAQEERVAPDGPNPQHHL
ncbi:hypothetical protein MLD38_030566 [Melastoma candidum]|uniref:Uncharacterized protein n=1 Tax=Melastoma candidum TaxID=119954 RepID=A0ACB9MN79_9MYRT|nr:hypothetical protein MLD38_030566 [Melastoma candidum]